MIRPIVHRLALSVVVVACCSCSPEKPLEWETVHHLIDSDFPDVPGLTTEELARRLEAGSRDVVVLDARETEEYAVSHLPGAHHVASDVDAAARLADASPDALIVAYCSVGYRSAALVARLIERGYPNAVNLEGSIFRWASEDRALVRGDTPVREVHPYNDRWGALLPPDLWAYTPSSPE